MESTRTFRLSQERERRAVVLLGVFRARGGTALSFAESAYRVTPPGMRNKGFSLLRATERGAKKVLDSVNNFRLI
jgi:hypothetical protein